MLLSAYTLALVPFMASRSIVTVFGTALFARIAPGWEWTATVAGVQLAGDLPTWFTSDGALFILGLMSLIEAFCAAHSQTIRDAGIVIGPPLKALAAFLLSYNLVNDTFNEMFRTGDGATASFALGFSFVWSAIIAWSTWQVTQLRAYFYAFLDEMDEDDDLGLKTLLGWLESMLGFWGALYVMVAPILALISAALAVLGLYLFKKWVAHREKKKMVPCNHCGQPRHLCGIWCYACAKNPEPIYQVGFLGMIKKKPVTNWDDHQFQMAAKKRCFYCGERFKERQILQRCTGCQQPPFPNRAALDTYVQKVSQRFWPTMMWTALFGLIPVIGVIPGVLYYRIRLTSCLRTYIPRSVGCFARWAIRLIALFLIAVQPFGLGLLTLPILCWLNYSVYRATFDMEARRVFRGGQVPALDS